MNEAGAANRRAPVPGVSHPPRGAAVRLICAWCGAIIKDGPGPVSHGICGPCAAPFDDLEPVRRVPAAPPI